MRSISTVAVGWILGSALGCSPIVQAEPARAIDDCAVEQAAARNGQAPAKRLVHRLITCLWEHPAHPNLGGAVTVDISQLDIAAARTWGEPTDIGLGYLNTKVWPVTAQYRISRHDFDSQWVVEREDVFNCFVNTSRVWQCTRAYSLRDETVQQLAAP